MNKSLKYLPKVCVFALFISLIWACNKASDSPQTKTESESSVKSEIENNEAESTELLVPGVQMGGFVLDSNADSVLKMLPKPDFDNAAMGKVLLRWDDIHGGVLMMFNTQQMGIEEFKRIKIVRSLSPMFRTKNNAGVGSALSEIQQYFSVNKKGIISENNQQYTLFADPAGIGFELDEDNICRGVLIFSPEDAGSYPYIPFYNEFERLE